MIKSSLQHVNSKLTEQAIAGLLLSSFLVDFTKTSYLATCKTALPTVRAVCTKHGFILKLLIAKNSTLNLYYYYYYYEFCGFHHTGFNPFQIYQVAHSMMYYCTNFSANLKLQLEVIKVQLCFGSSSLLQKYIRVSCRNVRVSVV